MIKNIPEATLHDTLGWLRLQSKPVLAGLASERHLATGNVNRGDMVLFYDGVHDFDGTAKFVKPETVRQALKEYQQELGCGEGHNSTSDHCRAQITEFPVAGKKDVFFREETIIDEESQFGRIDVSIISKERPARIALRQLFHKN